ncbi:MAG: queuosine precursor transporter [Asticcacaulis sp.]
MPWLGEGKLGFSYLASVITYILTYTISDLVNRHFGAEEARRLVKPGLYASIMASFFFYVFINMKPDQNFLSQNGGYYETFNSAIYFTIGGLVAYFSSEYLNILVFSKIDKKYRLISNPIAGFISHAIDTSIYVAVAIYACPYVAHLFGVMFSSHADLSFSFAPWHSYFKLAVGQFIAKNRNYFIFTSNFF